MEISKEELELSSRLRALTIESAKRSGAAKKLMEVKKEINERIDSQINELFKELDEIHKEGDEIVARMESMEKLRKQKTK